MEIFSLVVVLLVLGLLGWWICLIFVFGKYPELESHSEHVKRKLRKKGLDPSPVPDNCIVEMIETLSGNHKPGKTLQNAVGILRKLLDENRRFDRTQIPEEIIQILRKYEVLDPTLNEEV